MPTELVVQDSADGGSVTLQPADPTGNYFRNDGQTVLKVVGPFAEFELVVANGRDCSFGDHPDFVITAVAGTTTIDSSRFKTKRFNDPDGFVHFTYQPNAIGIQIAAVRYSAFFKDEG